eukprot:CAMPEP_0206172636 /NCGR_PEP_ID=MMETSP1474-20131121/46179_1 /ASSEMBLY_ACC=CAM_ASM_001110 /TAXON_ID=97495 /ORGANISM="Imantonia sp., Strain RCC918" /LENGTH=205 /DNA_ID=CAMNT_0053580917 /DNA_START=138 /DNA_END=756 /DNA_ORIENTATION=-
MARKYHPDGTEGDTEKFKRIVEAYQVLSDGEKRRDYDRTTQGPFKQNYQEYYSSTQQEQQDFEDLEDIFSHFGFGSFGGHKEEAFDDFFDFRTNRSSRSKKNSPKPKKKKKKNGSKVTVHMSLSFMEAVHGTTRDVTFTADENVEVVMLQVLLMEKLLEFVKLVMVRELKLKLNVPIWFKLLVEIVVELEKELQNLVLFVVVQEN